jgi:hypothetical protein
MSMSLLHQKVKVILIRVDYLLGRVAVLPGLPCLKHESQGEEYWCIGAMGCGRGNGTHWLKPST